MYRRLHTLTQPFPSAATTLPFPFPFSLSHSPSSVMTDACSATMQCAAVLQTLQTQCPSVTTAASANLHVQQQPVIGVCPSSCPSSTTAPNTLCPSAATAAATSSSAKHISIQIISDNICPFCFLGKKKIELAVARLPADVKVSYEWRPYQLDETLPVPSMNKMERYTAKFGAVRVGGMLEQMKINGKNYGINFDYGQNIQQQHSTHAK